MTKTAPLPAPAPCCTACAERDAHYSDYYALLTEARERIAARDALNLRRLAVAGGLITTNDEVW